eukprot:TRINITY_DN4272_c1_g1_i1.p1 TRINITY_DN4272_c1_g1~~TRINITY_DN4272_c1_g1_i1.p1  ORF type:complete len:882 (+),score=324.30 TRINITY_DN4272_c1_g1_i1:133-2778(+)
MDMPGLSSGTESLLGSVSSRKVRLPLRLDEQRVLRRRFYTHATADVDGAAVVTPAELAALWEASFPGAELPAELTAARFREIDIDSDGAVDCDELLAVCSASGASSDAAFYREQMRRAETKVSLGAYTVFVTTLILVMLNVRSHQNAIDWAVTSNTFLDDFKLQSMVEQRRFDGMSTLDDWWTWLQGPGGLVQQLWGRPNGTVLLRGASFTIGAVKLRQLRVPPTLCSDTLTDEYSGWAEVEGALRLRRAEVRQAGLTTSDLACFDNFGLLNDAGEWSPLVREWTEANCTEPADPYVAPWCRADCGEIGGHGNYFGLISLYPCSGFALVLPVNSTIDEVNANLTRLRDEKPDRAPGPWIDAATRLLAVEFFLYSENLDMFIWFRFGAELTAGGGVVPRASSLPFAISKIGSARSVSGFAGLFVLLLFALWYMTNSIVRSCADTKRKLQQRRKAANRRSQLSSKIATWWNVVMVDQVWYGFDLIVFSYFLVVWVAHVVVSAWGVDGSLLQEARPPPNLEFVAYLWTLLRGMDSILFFLCIVRVVFYLELLSHHVSLINQSLRHAAASILALGIVLLTFFFGMVLWVHRSYGEQLLEFSTLDDSVYSLIKFLFVGDLGDVGVRMHQTDVVGRLLTPVFFIVFYVLLIFGFLNLVIAVLTGAYDAARQEQFNARPVHAALDSCRARAFRKQRFWEMVWNTSAVREVRWVCLWVLLRCGCCSKIDSDSLAEFTPRLYWGARLREEEERQLEVREVAMSNAGAVTRARRLIGGDRLRRIRRMVRDAQSRTGQCPRDLAMERIEHDWRWRLEDSAERPAECEGLSDAEESAIARLESKIDRLARQVEALAAAPPDGQFSAPGPPSGSAAGMHPLRRDGRAPIHAGKV